MDRNDGYDVVGLDAVDATQIKAEAERRGLPVEQVLREKITEGLLRACPFLIGPNSPSKGPRKH